MTVLLAKSNIWIWMVRTLRIDNHGLDCDIDDNDMKFIIKYLFTTTTLEVVDLENNKITDKGFDMLFAIYNYVTDFISKHPATLTPQPVDSMTTETHKRPRETYVPSIPKIPIIHLESTFFFLLLFIH